MGAAKEVHQRNDNSEHVQVVVLRKIRDIEDQLSKGRQLGAEALEGLGKLRHDFDQEQGCDDHGNRHDGDRIGESLLDFRFQLLGFFLVGRDSIEHGFEGSRAFSGCDQ